MIEDRVEVMLAHVRDHVEDRHNERPAMDCPVCASLARTLDVSIQQSADWARPVPGPAGAVH